MRISWPSLLLLVLSAALQIIIFPVAGSLPFWRAQLAWFAFIPLLLVLAQTAASRTRPLLHGTLAAYGCGALFYLGNCYWIFAAMHQYGGLPVPVALVVLLLYCFYLGLYHALFGLFATLLLRARSRPLRQATPVLLAALWVALELARARVTSVPWDLLGYSQIDNAALMRLAPFTGTYGISFVIVLANALLASGIAPAVSRMDQATQAPWYRTPTALAGAAIASASMLAGTVLRAPRPAPQASAILVQPNLAATADEHASAASPLEQQLATLSERAAQQPLPPSAPEPDLILWPESPSSFELRDPQFQAILTGLAARLHSTVIANANDVVPDNTSPRRYRLYNAAGLFTAQGLHAQYAKIHLVPFGEFVPYSSIFRFASGLTEQVGFFDRGTMRLPLHDGAHSYGVFICYESIFGDEVRQFARHGADVLVNLSDDGWYGDTSAPFQHIDMARMRAIENRRWILRDTNNGITASIDPYGNVREAVPRHQRLAAVMQYGYNTGLTFYTRHGDWFAYACTLLTLLALLSTLRNSSALQRNNTQPPTD